MRSDNRLSRMLHVLLHMAEQDAPLTSETIGKMLSTNPVVVRRMMSGLRERGYVQSEKGHGGGWVLTQPLSELSLLDVYQALGEPPIFSRSGWTRANRSAWWSRPSTPGWKARWPSRAGCCWNASRRSASTSWRGTSRNGSSSIRTARSASG